MHYWEEFVSVTQRNSHAWKQQLKRKFNFFIYLGNVKHTTIYLRTKTNVCNFDKLNQDLGTREIRALSFISFVCQLNYFLR